MIRVYVIIRKVLLNFFIVQSAKPKMVLYPDPVRMGLASVAPVKKH